MNRPIYEDTTVHWFRNVREIIIRNILLHCYAPIVKVRVES